MRFMSLYRVRTKEEIMKILCLQVIFVVISLLFTPRLSYASSTSKVTVYATDVGCSTCPNDPKLTIFINYLDELKKTLSNIGITDVQVFYLNRDESNQLYRSWNLSDEMRADLAVNIDDKYFFINWIPVRIISDFLTNYKDHYKKMIMFKDYILEVYKIMDENGKITECKIKDSLSECIKEENPVPLYFTSALPLIVVGGLLDGINPCAFAVLLFFTSFITITTRSSSWKEVKQKILFLGSAYIIGVYLAYLMIGLTIIRAFSVIGFPHIIGKIGALLVILLGLIDIKNYLQPGKLNLSMSSSEWIIVRRYLRKCTFPAAFIAGFSAGLFEFPCTGGIYIAILGLLAHKATFMQGFVYLIIYNIAFVLPLMIILIFSSSKKIIRFSLEKWQQHSGKRMRLLSGLIMVAIGVFLLSFGLV